MVVDHDHRSEGTGNDESAAASTEPFRGRIGWRAGGLAGLVATVAMGIAIVTMDVTVLRGTIAGLYGFEGSLVSGWIAHLAHGTLFGVVFAAILSDPALNRLTDWAWKTVLAGIVYGVVLAVFGAGFIMPIWLALVGVDTGLAVPAVTTSIVVWHLLYGVILGVGYYGAAGRN